MDCGMGLSNIASRINSLGGTFDLQAAPGKGMRALIRIDLLSEQPPQSLRPDVRKTKKDN